MGWFFALSRVVGSPISGDVGTTHGYQTTGPGYRSTAECSSGGPRQKPLSQPYLLGSTPKNIVDVSPPKNRSLLNSSMRVTYRSTRMMDTPTATTTSRATRLATTSHTGRPYHVNDGGEALDP
jgi:hypothetical protein